MMNWIQRAVAFLSSSWSGEIIADQGSGVAAQQKPKTKNIYVVGAQCTGKTTLVNALVPHFGDANPLLIKEVARGVLREHKYAAKDITNSPVRALKLQHLIFAAQVAAEGKAGDNWFISDRSALDPIVYAKIYVGEDAAAKMLESEAWQVSRLRMRDGLVFVCETGNFGWLGNGDDGVRLRDRENWMALHEQFCKLLQEQGIPFTVVTRGMLDLADRVELILGMVS